MDENGDIVDHIQVNLQDSDNTSIGYKINQMVKVDEKDCSKSQQRKSIVLNNY